MCKFQEAVPFIGILGQFSVQDNVAFRSEKSKFGGSYEKKNTAKIF